MLSSYSFINAFKRSLSESIIVDNRDKRLVITSHNKRERPLKRRRTNSQFSSLSIFSFQVSISVSDAFSSPPFQIFQDALYSSIENQEVNKEALNVDSIKESLKDISNNFFEDIELISNDFFEDIELLDDLSSFSPYLSLSQSLTRLRRYITRYSYTEESKRYYLSFINIICNRYGAAFFKNKTEK